METDGLWSVGKAVIAMNPKMMVVEPHNRHPPPRLPVNLYPAIPVILNADCIGDALTLNAKHGIHGRHDEARSVVVCHLDETAYAGAPSGFVSEHHRDLVE